MDTFNDNLSPEEIKMATIAFMGQHLTGDLKELNKNIISQSSTLRSNPFNPAQIINTIPSGHRPSPTHTVVNASVNLQQPLPAPINHVHVHEQTQSLKETVIPNNDLKEIISILKRIEDKLDKVRIS